MRNLWILLLAICWLRAGAESADSLGREAARGVELPPTLAAATLIAGGATVSAADAGFRAQGSTYTARGNSLIDNALPYTPLAATVALKACGVPTRSSWGGLALNTAASAVIMAGLTEGIKHTLKEERPDGSNRHSMPSGHTAQAFMCAHIMAKELGATSGWYSAGAYTVATATAMTRIFNNRHWAGDVVMGAGIGIASVELGYWLVDIFGKGKWMKPTCTDNHWSEASLCDPAWIGVAMGVSTRQAVVDGLRMGTATTMTLEGAAPVWRRLAIGGRARLTAAPIAAPEGPGAPIGLISIGAGAYYSLPLGSHWQAGASVTGGPMITTRFTLDSPEGVRLAHWRAQAVAEVSVGLSASYTLRGHTATFKVDYSHSRPRIAAGSFNIVAFSVQLSAFSL